jgi:hypothetical protein
MMKWMASAFLVLFLATPAVAAVNAACDCCSDCPGPERCPCC